MAALIIIVHFSFFCRAGNIELIKRKTIKTVKLFPVGDQLSYPIVPLNAMEQLELHFDDICTSSKNYYYTYQLCDANWNPLELSQFDYIKGFSQVRLTQPRFSSVGLTRYVHYSVKLPVANCMPSRSGNYLLKVFENGDTNNLIFTKRLLVLDNKVGLTANIVPPFSGMDFRSRQRVAITLNTNNLDIFNTNQQIKIVVLQNYRWDNAQSAEAPTFLRQKNMEYNQEGLFDFEAGKEWRWLDLRSFRLQSERVKTANYSDTGTDIFVTTDTARPSFRYQYYRDYNGLYFIDMYENYNPWWQSDYAKVHFTFIPPNHQPFNDKDLFLIGEISNYCLNDDYALEYNETKQVYEKTLFLKNGYYNYCYVTKSKNLNGEPSFKETEGNAWDTENSYTILVYYKDFGGRSDQLVGAATINSLAILK